VRARVCGGPDEGGLQPVLFAPPGRPAPVKPLVRSSDTDLVCHGRACSPARAVGAVAIAMWPVPAGCSALALLSRLMASPE